MVIPLWVTAFSLETNLHFLFLAQHINVPPREFLAVLLKGYYNGWYGNVVRWHVCVRLRTGGVAAVDLADDRLAGQFVSLEFVPPVVFDLDVKVEGYFRRVRQLTILVGALEVSLHLITDATHGDFPDLPVGHPLFRLVMPFLLDVILDLYIDVVINVDLGNNVFDVIRKL